jgi:hypothetical protein
MMHEVWGPTAGACSLGAAPTTGDFAVEVERTVQLLLPNMSLQDTCR